MSDSDTKVNIVFFVKPIHRFHLRWKSMSWDVMLLVHAEKRSAVQTFLKWLSISIHFSRILVLLVGSLISRYGGDFYMWNKRLQVELASINLTFLHRKSYSFWANKLVSTIITVLSNNFPCFCNSADIYSHIFSHLSNHEQRNYQNFIKSLNYGTFDPRNG